MQIARVKAGSGAIKAFWDDVERAVVDAASSPNAHNAEELQSILSLN